MPGLNVRSVTQVSQYGPDKPQGNAFCFDAAVAGALGLPDTLASINAARSLAGGSPNPYVLTQPAVATANLNANGIPAEYNNGISLSQALDNAPPDGTVIAGIPSPVGTVHAVGVRRNGDGTVTIDDPANGRSVVPEAVVSAANNAVGNQSVTIDPP